MKTASYLFVLLFIGLCFQASAQQIANADTAVNLSDTGDIKQTTLNNLQRLVDSTRRGYHGPIIIAVDKNYQPVDSVRVVLLPDNVYDATPEQVKKYITICTTNSMGFSRTNSIGGGATNIMGLKGNTVYYFRESTYIEAEYDALLILRPHYDKAAPEKKGIRLNLHNQPKNQ
jgi:hypothetical protein